MERIDLLNALRLVRDYCESTKCSDCGVEKKCDYIFATIPEDWDLGDDV